jgi:hypothetical protein
MQRVRWPKSFSPFSGSDSDSDGQTAQRHARPSPLHLDIPKGSTNQSANGSQQQTIQGIYLFCAGDQVDLSTLRTPLVPNPVANIPTMGLATVSPSDAIFNASSTPLPISSLIGIPLLMRRLAAKPSPSSPHFENTLAFQLSVDPQLTATTPDPATRGLGTVLVIRADREPLQKDLLDRICAFHAKLLNLAQQKGSGGMGETLKTWATPEKFLMFCMESYRPDGGNSKANISNSVHEMLGGSWLDLQRPMATV